MVSSRNESPPDLFRYTSLDSSSSSVEVWPPAKKSYAWHTSFKSLLVKSNKQSLIRGLIKTCAFLSILQISAKVTTIPSQIIKICLLKKFCNSSLLGFSAEIFWFFRSDQSVIIFCKMLTKRYKRLSFELDKILSLFVSWSATMYIKISRV